MKTISFVFGCISLLLCALADAQDPKFEKLEISNGPLLFLTHPEDPDGNPATSGKDRKEVIYLFDPESRQEPQRFWEGDSDNRPEPISIMSPGVLLVTQNDRSFLLTLNTGQVSKLLQTEKPTKVVSIEDNKIFFVEGHRGPRLTGFKLKTENGKTIVDSYVREHGLFYVLDFSLHPKQAKRLASFGIESIMAETMDSFWVVSSGKDRSVFRIRKNGNVQKIAPFDDQWILPLTSFNLSPDLKFVALTTLDAGSDFHEERDLIVMDVENTRIVSHQQRLTDLYPYTGGSPRFLAAHWLNESSLVFGYSHPQVLDLTTGKTKAFQPKSQGQEKTRVATSKRKRTVGQFEVAFGEVYLKGQANPIASTLDDRGISVQDMDVCPNGDWAAFVSSKDHHTYLVDGKAKEKRRLIRGWSYNLVWIDQSKDSDKKDYK